MTYSWACNLCLHLLLLFCGYDIVKTIKSELDQAMANADYHIDALIVHSNQSSFAHPNAQSITSCSTNTNSIS